jgi:pimeloyl-ACP methyl ester carboxylesterase
MMHKPCSPLRAIVIVTILSVSLAACGRAERAIAVPEGARAGDLAMEPCVFKTETTEYKADCGTLVVPENRAEPSSRLIALPVTRIHAASDSPAEPIFWLEGGPGLSNMEATPPDWLLADHDFVLVGYRGADGSSVLHCPEVNRAITGVGDDALSTGSLDHIASAMGQCAERLQGEGVDLAGYSIAEVVEDMESARTGLGYGRVSLLSESYGTRVAQVYAYLYPESLHRSVMIGVNPPGHFVWEPATIDAQLAYYAHLCAQDAACSARTPDLAQTMWNVTHDMPRRWLLFPIDPGKVRQITFVLLYHRDTAASVFDIYIAAEQGDASGLALMSLAYDLIMPSVFIWGDTLTKGSGPDYDPARNYVAELDRPDTILGSPVGLLIWGPASKAWPVNQLPAGLRRAHPSDVETLLVSGSVDFSTPPQFATDELLPYLSRGQQVILAEMGHTQDVWSVQPEATERLLTSFYDTGVADDSLYTYVPMSFEVGLGFPLLAKIAVGVLLLVVVAGIAAARFAIRRVRRRPTP